jgi:U4/U6.U5 tri-snRNP component SNU23
MKPVSARSESLNLDSNVGKATTVSAGAPQWTQGGFFCEICDCLLKDSVSYLDHLNGKKRQYPIHPLCFSNL